MLRCRRTDDEKPIEPQLLMLLSHVYDHFGGKPIEIVSGYPQPAQADQQPLQGHGHRHPHRGRQRRRRSGAFAETLDGGGMGIGIYPRSQFVHIDVRPPPSYRWIDYSPPNPNAAEKRPPRGWKRKKLES